MIKRILSILEIVNDIFNPYYLILDLKRHKTATKYVKSLIFDYTERLKALITLWILTVGWVSDRIVGHWIPEPMFLIFYPFLFFFYIM